MNNGSDKINIFGINVHKLTKQAVRDRIAGYLSGADFRYIVTVNPEFILKAGEDEEFFYILNHADLSVPDGVGLWFAGITLGANLHRYPGVDMVRDILADTSRAYNIFIVNWREGLLQGTEIKAFLEKKYPQHRFLCFDTDSDNRTFDAGKLGDFTPDILLVTFGAPWQEKFVFSNQHNFPSVRLAIGIGGTLDFLTGRVKRSPKILRVLGFEWLWRALYHRGKAKGDRRKRWRRIFRAAVVFPWKFVIWRFILPFLYRPNVACLVYKTESGKKYILMVERADDKGHWQILQGGTDGLGIEAAGRKEIAEELGTDKIRNVAVYKNLHKYIFPDDAPRHRGAEYMKHTGYKGQKQSLLIGEFYGRDEDIKISYWDHTAWQWVPENKALETVHPLRRGAMGKYMEKFNEVIGYS